MRPTDRVLPCACASLRRAARAVTQRYDAALRETGLRATQFTILQVLMSIGQQTQGRLEYILAIDSTTLSRTLRPLKTKGWIRSEPGVDRRQRWWTVTQRGKEALENARPAWDRAQAELRDRIGDERWAPLLAQLAEVSFLARV